MKLGLTTPVAASALAAAALVPSLGLGAGAPDPPSLVTSFPGHSGPAQLTVSGSAADNVVSVDIDAATNVYLVSDQVGLTAGENCFNTGPTTAVCQRLGNEQLNDGFVAALKGGDDRFTMVAASRSGRVLGDRGDDRITGSAANSRLDGDAGRDVLRGLGGEDNLSGGLGRDRFYAGPGDDRLHANNDDRDQTIACGPGDDRAVVDRGLDPEPKNCEQIKRR